MDMAQKALLEDATGRDALKTLLDAFGGFTTVAKALKHQFEKLPDGHPAKIKLLMMITHAVIRFGEGSVGSDDLSENEAQLTRLLQELK